MLTFLSVWRDRVNATEPVYWSPGDPGPPEPPSFDEWRAMQARPGTYGSAEVSDAFRNYWEAIFAFYERVKELRMIRQGHAEGSLADAGPKVEEARSNVRETLNA
jgi:hypothetical protein